MKKKWQKMLIPFIAILVIGVIAFRKPEGFQNANLAAVGLQFTGSLSTIYNRFTSIEAGESVFGVLMKNPISVIPDFLKKHPTLKYSIVQVSTGNTIYDPIAQYEKNKTMDPFPNTTNSDEYVIYSNMYNMPITKEQAKTFYPHPPYTQDIMTNCTTQDTRNKTQDIVLSHRRLNSSASKVLDAMARNSNIVPISDNLSTFNQQVSIDPTTKTRQSELFTWFTQDEQVGANAAGLAAAGYTGNPADLSTLTATQIQSYNTAVIAYLKSTVSYADVVLYDEVNTLSINIGEKTNTVSDYHVGLLASIGGLTYKSTIYEPCVVFTSGFQNMEGFTVDKSQLYDYSGNKVFPGAPALVTVAKPVTPTPAAAKAAPAAKAEEMSNTTITLIALGGVSVIGGGTYLAMNYSKFV